jgi:hypothetical protein
MTLRVTIVGVEQLVRRLGLATAQQVLMPPMVRSQSRLHRDLADYPSPPSGSTYDRTGDLGRAWTAPRPQATMNGITGTIGNAVRSRRGGRRYAPYVQKGRSQPKPHQADIHAGRWTTDEEALKKNQPAIERDFALAIGRALS